MPRGLFAQMAVLQDKRGQHVKMTPVTMPVNVWAAFGKKQGAVRAEEITPQSTTNVHCLSVRIPQLIAPPSSLNMHTQRHKSID